MYLNDNLALHWVITKNVRYTLYTTYGKGSLTARRMEKRLSIILKYNNVNVEKYNIIHHIKYLTI